MVRLTKEIVAVRGVFPRAGSVRLWGNQVDVGGSAQVGQDGFGHSLLCEIFGDGIHGQGDLDVQGSVEVGVTSHHKRFSGMQLEQPIPDEGSVGEKIASSVGAHLFPAGICR